MKPRSKFLAPIYWACGNEERGKEIINALKEYGGFNTSGLDGNISTHIYYIDEGHNIGFEDAMSKLALMIRHYGTELIFEQ